MMSFLDLATGFSLAALNVDIVLQNIRVFRRKSSRDISLYGVIARYVAIFVILIKYLSLNDWVLYLGQAVIATNVTVYLVLVIRYRHSKAI